MNIHSDNILVLRLIFKNLAIVFFQLKVDYKNNLLLLFLSNTDTAI